MGPDRITRNSYDAAGQLLKVQKAYGTPLQQDYATYTYTPNGKQETVKDANGNVTKLVYDGFDRQVAWVFPSRTTDGAQASCNIGTISETNGVVSPSETRGASDDCEKYAYDKAGNRVTLMKRDGSIIRYTYDALNRMTLKDVPGGSTGDVYYAYDLRGLQLSARYGSASGQGITNEYDGFGQLSSTTTNQGGASRKLSYTYDADGNRTSLTFPDTKTWTMTYDGLDRPDTIKEGTTPVVSYSYTTRGLVGQRVTGGVTTTYGYDGVGRLQSLADDLAGTADDVTTTLTYNPAGQIRTRVRSNDAYRFTEYKAVNRPYQVNGLNQYTSAGSASFCHDANGNLLADSTTAYRYDVENRLIEVRARVGTSCTPNYTGALKAALTYDPTGRLYEVASAGPSGTTRYLYDGDQLVAEYNAAGTLLRRYLHGNRDDDPLLWYEGAALTDRRSLQADAQGSIVSVANSSGSRLLINAYDEYGIPSSAASDGGTFRYTGQVYLKDLGLYHYKARVYSPTLGRFFQTDPVGYGDQINLYAYVANDPIDGRDPTGLQSITPESERDEERGLLEDLFDPAASIREDEYRALERELRQIVPNAPPGLRNPGPASEIALRSIRSEVREAALSRANELERGARQKERQASDHERKLAEFLFNRPVKPEMARMTEAQQEAQRQRRAGILQRDIAQFRKQAARDRAEAESLREKAKEYRAKTGVEP